ncbi:hypothetical protein QM012_004944 [Aureobasidium pullulans]|uniref:F-box domain-containing protein n=1 Tax=Aureobasidium pullulans TaxID=5580 RepID=A0ABR0T7F4_AURPU
MPSTSSLFFLYLATFELKKRIMDLFLRLPIEISNLVVDFLERESLTCLRLVCKKAHHIATPTFGRRYLHTLRPILFPECLNALVAISENKLLRGYVKSILFASYTLRQSVSLVEMILRQHKPEIKERLLKAHKHCIGKQQPLIESGQHIDLIAQALTNFRDAGAFLALGIFDNKHSNGSKTPMYKGWSADPYYNQLFELEAWFRDSGDVMNTVIQAANRCKYPLSSVELDLCVSMTIPMGARDALRPVDTGMDRILAQILSEASLCNSKLVFRFDITPVSDECMTSRLDIDWQHRRLSFHSLQRSRETKLACFRGLAGLGKLTNIFGINTFCEIDLSRCEAETYILSKFLRAHSGSLKRLRLSRIVFRGPYVPREAQEISPAAKFPRMLKDDLKHLEYLELEHLTGSNANWPTLPLFATNTKLEGRHDIEIGLDMWLQSLREAG